MDNVDVWAQIWPNPYPEGKVHKSVVRCISRVIGLHTRFETIYTLVEINGVKDQNDVLATSRAIRDLRNNWRKCYNATRRAITAK